MVQFIKANDEKLMDDRKFLARVTYNIGAVTVRALVGNPLRFEDLYKFPVQKTKKTPEQVRSELMAWAIQVESRTRKDKK